MAFLLVMVGTRDASTRPDRVLRRTEVATAMTAADGPDDARAIAAALAERLYPAWLGYEGVRVEVDRIDDVGAVVRLDPAAVLPAAG